MSNTVDRLPERVRALLRRDGRVWTEEGTLNQTGLLDLAERFDEAIIALLLSDEETKRAFFLRVGGAYVFKSDEFRFFIEEHKVDNSYTAYKNRIGLTDGKRFLKDTGDVALHWPYKDCVLEGGQSTEEGRDTYFEYAEEKTTAAEGATTTRPAGYKEKQAKRKEIFFNQVLARDEIDRLFDEKALANWKHHTKDGAREAGNIKRDADGTIRENMIIKGNNLLALHSLRRQRLNYLGVTPCRPRKRRRQGVGVPTARPAHRLRAQETLPATAQSGGAQRRHHRWHA